MIERQVRQLVRLVDDLLDVSRITANKIQLRREPLDLARLMATAVESITPLADGGGSHAGRAAAGAARSMSMAMARGSCRCLRMSSTTR